MATHKTVTINELQTIRRNRRKTGLFCPLFFDFPPRAFAIITHRLSHFYWEIYDKTMPVFNSRASSMSDEEL